MKSSFVLKFIFRKTVSALHGHSRYELDQFFWLTMKTGLRKLTEKRKQKLNSSPKSFRGD